MKNGNVYTYRDGVNPSPENLPGVPSSGQATAPIYDNLVWLTRTSASLSPAGRTIATRQRPRLNGG
ncbi:MAG: hypothetical protein ACK55Z_04515 [bacterium]